MSDERAVAYDPAAEVVEICRDLIRIDTSNYGDDSGPGERKAAEHVAGLLAEVGMEPEILEAAPGRTSLVARWGRTGGAGDSGDRLLIHGHLDVVPAQSSDWQVDPFSGELRDGYLWGRGAVDMKDFDAMLLSVVRARARGGAVPRRPITLCFTADEEAGSSYGAHWLVDHHRDAFEGCTEAIGEVGGYSLSIGDQRLYLIETGEKGMLWMRLRARGTAGHGSMRNSANAVTTLAEAVARIGRYEWPVQVGEAMGLLLEELAGITEPTGDPDQQLAAAGPASRMLGAAIRNTTNPTMLSAGYKLNVIPGEAVAYVDGRFLPGQRDQLLERMRKLAGADVELDLVNDDVALETGFDGQLVDVMTQVLTELDPGARVAPYLMSGGTDGKAWNRLGIRCLGFTPLRLPPDLDFTALFHGVDERVPVDALAFGASALDRFLDLV
jgi:acetylornithine deacetylase/succinyl-diaminopimelate desuccinylase-like protein